jgi:hypothetical protein
MNSWLETVRRKPLTVLGAGVGMFLVIWVVWSLLTPHRDLVAEAMRKRGYPASATELDRWYPYVPPPENRALFYTNAFESLTNSVGPITNFTSRTWLPPIGQGLSAEDREQVKSVLSEHQAALGLLYSAPASGGSRYPIHLEDGPATLLPHLAKLKMAVSLLSAEGLLHATEGDAEKATRAFLTAGRVAESVSEEPIVISQLVRYACWAILLPRLERALSLAPFTDAQLASLQALIEPAERPKAEARAWAGGLAMHLSVFTDPKVMQMALRELRGSSSQPSYFLASATISLYRFTGLLQKDKAYLCEQTTRELSALELPFPARFAACQKLAASTNLPPRAYFFSRMLLPAIGVFHIRAANHVALVRVAATGLAVERFRLAHTNALPQSLEELVPAYGKAVTADPYDGQPLHYKTHGASYVVYSIGCDLQDDGGVDWDSNYTKTPQDVAFVVKH